MNSSPKAQANKARLDALGAVLDVIADCIAAKVAGTSTAGGALRLYTSASSPLPPRTFRRLARSGAFPSFREARTIIALADDVDGYLRQRTRAPRPTPTPTKATALDAWCASRGVRPAQRRGEP